MSEKDGQTEKKRKIEMHRDRNELLHATRETLFTVLVMRMVYIQCSRASNGGIDFIVRRYNPKARFHCFKNIRREIRFTIRTSLRLSAFE